MTNLTKEIKKIIKKGKVKVNQMCDLANAYDEGWNDSKDATIKDLEDEIEGATSLEEKENLLTKSTL